MNMLRIIENVSHADKDNSGRADRFWSLREDLHRRFGFELKSHLIDSVLDGAIAEYDRKGGIGVFRKVLLDREVAARLGRMAGGGRDLNYAMAMYLGRAA